MQLDELAALTSLLQTIKETKKLKSLPLAQWLSTTMKKIKEENGEREYQCHSLKKFDLAEAFFISHHAEFCTKVTEYLQSRMARSGQEIIRDIITTLATQGWEKILEDHSSLDFIERLRDICYTSSRCSGRCEYNQR